MRTLLRRFHAAWPLLLLSPFLLCCARMEEGIYVPESLEYQGVPTRPVLRFGGDISCVTARDSTIGEDAVVTLLVYSDVSRKKYEKFATGYEGSGIDGGYDEKNFTFPRYPGMQRVGLAPLAFFPDTGNRPWTLYHMYFKDSIVVGLHAWGPSERWLRRLTLGREDAHYLMPLALWRPAGQDHWFYAFRKSNRIRYFRTAVPDTLFIWDLTSGTVTARRPVGAYFCAHTERKIQRDSVLVLTASRCDNGLHYGGFDDGHQYLVGLRADGGVVWADTLPFDRTAPEHATYGTAVDGRVLLTRLVDPDHPRTSPTLLIVCDPNRHDTPARLTLHASIRSIERCTRHPDGHMEYYCRGRDESIWVLDSAFTPRLHVRLPFTTGLNATIGGPESESRQIEPFERFVDINNDSTNDFWEVASTGQVVVLDGRSLTPLMATPLFPTLEKCGFIRQRDGGIVLALWDQDALRSFTISATPLDARILAHQDRIITVGVLCFILPLLGYFIWRVEYFRQLFRLLISESRDQGVMVIRMKSLGRTLRNIAAPHTAAIARAEPLGLMNVQAPTRWGRRPVSADAASRAILTANDRMRALFGIAGRKNPDLGQYPPKVAELVDVCIHTGQSRAEQIILTAAGGKRHLVVAVRRMTLLGRFHRCVVTATDITESIEAERRRTLAEREARHQREMLTTTVKIVHDAKTPLQTARLILNAMMIDDAGSFLATADAEREEQSAAIESSITEAVDIINRCLFLAREAQHNAGLRPMNLHRAVGAWCEKTASRYGSRGFTVRNTVPEDLPELMLDQTGLEFLLQCACDNAVQWTPHDSAEKTVRIAARRAPDAVVLEIIDTGVGMEPETVRRLLESPGFSLREMGSGLGMLIIHRVCAEHRARLSITSTLGEGTTIAISFPLSSDFTEHAS